MATTFTTAVLIFFIVLTYPHFKDDSTLINKRHILQLLKVCFPLFAGCSLAFYIENAPKYAIDRLLNDEAQACYGFIAMPVFVIGLLNNFIFSPMIAKMSLLWSEGSTKEFLKLFKLQILIIAGITVMCEIGAYILRIPVLSLLYNTNLETYKGELLVLLLGEGLLALSGLLVTIMTILRIQNSQAIGYAIIAILAYILSPVFVQKYAVMGASILYLLLMMLLCVIFGGVLTIQIKRD